MKFYKLLFLALLIFAFACTSGEDATTPAENDNQTETDQSSDTSADPPTTLLRVGAPADDYRLDPEDAGRVTLGMSQVNTNIFEGLTTMDTNFQIQPRLAESWEYLPDSGGWRFYLRQDVTFHDGSPLTAQSVVEMVERVSQGGFAILLRVDENSATIVDDHTVDIIPIEPNVQLPGQIAHPHFGLRAAGSDPFAGEHIGTGPFMLKEYVPDDHISVVKNPDYYSELAQVDEIIFRFMPDPNTRVLALQAGDVDVIYDVPRESATLLMQMDELNVMPATVGAYQAVSVMATGESPYDIGSDALVREAIAYAIDRQNIVDVAMGGMAEMSQTLIPAAVLGDSADQITGFTHDPDRAMQLLEEAGWTDSDGDGIREKDGRTLTLEIVSGYPTANDNGQTPEVLQAQLRTVGIEANITAINDSAAYNDRLTAKQGDLWVEIGNQNSASPCFLPSFLYYGGNDDPNNYQSAFAPTYAGVDGFDAAMDACNESADPATAAANAAAAVHVLVDEAHTALPLIGLYRIWATADHVSDFTPHPIFVMIRWDGVTVP